MKSKDYWEKYEEIDILKISAKFYKLNTIKIIESFNPKVILDYGSGSGEIALQLKNEKNNIICYEPIPHMFNKLKSTFLILFGMAVLWSCESDLELTPEDNRETAASAFEDPAAYKQFLAKLYAGFAISGMALGFSIVISLRPL